MLKLHSFVFAALMAFAVTAGCAVEDEAAAPDDQLEDGAVDQHAELTSEEAPSFALDGDEPAGTTSSDLGKSRRRVVCATLSPFETRRAAIEACALRNHRVGGDRIVRADVTGTAPRLQIECCWRDNGGLRE